MRPHPRKFHRQTTRPNTGRLSQRVSRASLLAILLVLLVAVPIASAAVVLSDDRTTIRADQTLTEDAYIFGDAVTINGTAQFDVVAATNTFDLGETGRVGGNVNVAANDVRLRGPIDRSVRVAAREVVITGTVGGDVWSPPRRSGSNPAPQFPATSGSRPRMSSSPARSAGTSSDRRGPSI